MRAVFDHSEDESKTIRTFWFKPEQSVRYTAGQFTELTLPHKDPDSRGIKRWYTLSSVPGGEMVSITTRRAEKDGSSFKRALWALEPGDAVDLAEAMGDFVLPIHTQTPVIFVAGGIGITPFHSILDWLATVKEQRDIRLLWSVRTESDIIFQDTINSSGVHATIMVSEPSESWGGERGRLDAEKIIGLAKPSGDTLIYLSGPEPMLEALSEDLKKAGVDQHNIITDFFPGYQSL